MVSAALTSFLTGITEPIEFSFLFVAPLLYGIHALLAGVAYFTCITLGIKHGTTFSHGLIDYVVLFSQSTRGLWYLWLGPIWAFCYYTIFRVVIARFDLKTPGREAELEAWPRQVTPAPRASWRTTSCSPSAGAPTSRTSTPASPGCGWSFTTSRRRALNN